MNKEEVQGWLIKTQLNWIQFQNNHICYSHLLQGILNYYSIVFDTELGILKDFIVQDPLLSREQKFVNEDWPKKVVMKTYVLIKEARIKCFVVRKQDCHSTTRKSLNPCSFA